MSGRRNLRLRLSCILKDIRGQGDDLVYVVEGFRTNKAGRHEAYELELLACRHSVLQIQRGLRQMHKRDRDRLASEQRRITREIEALTNEETSP